MRWVNEAPVLIVVGVPDKLVEGQEIEWPVPYSRLTQARKPVDDLVHWERWPELRRP